MALITYCPCCGHSVDNNRQLVVDLSTNRISFHSHIVEVHPPRAAEFISVLADAWPDTVPIETITSRVWGWNPPLHPSHAVGLLAFLARPFVWQLHWNIASIVGRGYRLLEPGATGPEGSRRNFEHHHRPGKTGKRKEVTPPDS